MTHLSGDFLMVFANIGVAKRGATGICTLAPRKDTPPKPQRGKRSRPLDSVSPRGARTKAKPLHGRGPAQSQGIGSNKNAVKHDSEIIGIWNDYGNLQLFPQTFIMSYAIIIAQYLTLPFLDPLACTCQLFQSADMCSNIWSIFNMHLDAACCTYNQKTRMCIYIYSLGLKLRMGFWGCTQTRLHPKSENPKIRKCQNCPKSIFLSYICM